VVKKIADEHRATVRIANLRDAGVADSAEGAVHGARVSLSFSSFMPTPGPAAAEGEITKLH
jgi:nitrogen fixation/metabolism regulation signal transduction histidine kinase